jgi:hypothetical protein
LLSEGPDTLPRMNWPWRTRRELTPPASAPTEGGSRYSAAALDAFLEHARAMAAWHEARAGAFERKASTLLGFIGVILVLLPGLRTPIAKAHGDRMRMVLVALAILAAVLLALAALSAAMVLKPRGYTEPSLKQLRSEWTAYAKEGRAHRTPEHLTGLFVDQLVYRADVELSPLETLRNDARERSVWMERATWLVLFGVLTLAALTSALLVEGGA